MASEDGRVFVGGRDKTLTAFDSQFTLVKSVAIDDVLWSGICIGNKLYFELSLMLNVFDTQLTLIAKA